MSKVNNFIVFTILIFFFISSTLRGNTLVNESSISVVDTNSISEPEITLIEPMSVSLEENQMLLIQENNDMQCSENISAGEAGPEILAIGLAISVAILVWLIIETEKAHNPD